MSKLTRRKFTTTATLAGLTTALGASRVLGANDRIRLGFIGLGNRGDQVLDAFLPHKDAEVVALCDIYQPYLDFAAKKVGAGGTRPEQYRDYHKLLGRADVDAVVVCTPDHWHALMTVEACAAGKDVYVEKPLSLCVAEGRKMVEAARNHKRVVQVGIQRRSAGYCKEVAELIRGGGIGKVTAVRCFHIMNEWPKGIGNPPDSDPPQGFDWDAWLGPAPKVRYNKNRGFYRFRWFYDYSGGQLTNFGVHYLAQVHWALGVEAPRLVTALGGKFARYDNREVPDTLEVVWHYPGDTLVTFSQFNATAAAGAARPCEIEFRGTKGTLYFSTSGYEVVPDVIYVNEVTARTPVDRAQERRYRAGGKPLIEPRKVTAHIKDSDHARDFLDCVKSRKVCSCDVEYGHRVTTAALLGNIALKTKSVLEWDARAERFTNSTAANKLLSYEYRPPYKLPT
jgi:predicted dehydrogenase